VVDELLVKLLAVLFECAPLVRPSRDILLEVSDGDLAINELLESNQFQK